MGEIKIILLGCLFPFCHLLISSGFQELRWIGCSATAVISGSIWCASVCCRWPQTKTLCVKIAHVSRLVKDEVAVAIRTNGD